MTVDSEGNGRLVAGRYRLIGKLGSGGMGVVWQAYDERLHRKVAIKQLRLPAGLSEDEAAQAKLKIMREGRIAARLQHPHAIMVYDVAQDDGQPVLVMEYLQARSLADEMAERGTLPPAEAARIGADVAAALAAAHGAGVVHRDVKPGNVLIGDDGVVKITDFGISRAVEDVTGTLTSVVVGTPAYLSPEVARGDRASFPSDVYSLGSTLYAAVEGKPPYGFADNAIALLYRVGAGQFEPPDNAGPLTDVLMSLLRAEPGDRPTMAQASKALAAVAKNGHQPVAAPPPASEQPTERIEPPTRTALLPPDRPDDGPAPAPLGGFDNGFDNGFGNGPDNGGFDNDLDSGLAAPATPDRREDPDHGRRLAAVIAAAVIAVLAIGAALLALSDDEPGTAAPGPTAASSRPPAATSASEAASAPQSTAEPPPSTLPQTQQQQAPTTAAPQQPPPPPGSSQTPAAAITAYYALMPGNLEQGWTLLTPKYQRSPAGGFEGYQRFWGQIGSVQVSGVTPIGESQVDATVVYNFKDGRVVRERHSYFLVLDGGRWLIDTSRVVNSVTL